MSGTTLINKSGIYVSGDKWKLKNKGSLVYIENSSKNKVLAVGDDDIVNEETLIKNDAKQMWKKGVTNNEGYFTLTNSNKVMTAISDNCIGMKGRHEYNNNIYCICIEYRIIHQL